MGGSGIGCDDDIIICSSTSLFCIVSICTLNLVAWRCNKYRRSTRSKSHWWQLIELLSNETPGLLLHSKLLQVAAKQEEEVKKSKNGFPAAKKA
jgi:hypothetical protein